jgi:hypothetical protein
MKISLRNIGKNLILLAFCVVFTLGVIETAVRLFAPQQLIANLDNIWRPDSLLGHCHRESINEMVNFGEGTVHFVTDEHGYRINATGPDPVTADISLLIIGDSFLEALAMENEFTIPQQLAKRIREENDCTVRATNTSVGAWNPNHYYRAAQRALSEDHFNAGIVFVYVANDCVERVDTVFSPAGIGAAHSFRLPRCLNQKEIIQSVLLPTNDFLEAHSHLYILLKNKFWVLLAKVGLTSYYFPEVFQLSQQQSIRWDNVATLSSMIQAEFHRHDTPVLFILLPALYQIYPQEFETYLTTFDIPRESVDLELPNRCLSDAFLARSLDLVDVLEPLRTQAAGGLSLYGRVDRHLNEEGHRVVADVIYPKVKTVLQESLSPGNRSTLRNSSK